VINAKGFFNLHAFLCQYLVIMKSLFLKFFYLVALVKYPKLSKDYRYFVRDNYYCRLLQIKYIFADYLVKNKYKVVEFHGEFDQELRYVIPFAYWHHLNGTLEKTVSCKDTKELYFFSENHEEFYQQRDWQSAYESFEVPNMTHSISFSYAKWSQVPFKDYYQNEIFKWDKPILIIANKYNLEWDGPPINFFDIPVLDRIISTYGTKYQILYNRPLSSQIVSDNSDILDFNEYQWLKTHHPDVILINDLFSQHRELVNNFNHLQLMIYANANHFISVHGGTGTFASCFGGTNIILSKKGMEHDLNEFNTIFPALSNAKILHAKREEEIFEYMTLYY
jgi:hypothetical protein